MDDATREAVIEIIEDRIAPFKKELALFQLNSLNTLNEIKEDLKGVTEVLALDGGTLDLVRKRVSVLEEARQKQIELNERFLRKVPVTTVKRFSWFTRE